MSTLIGTQVSWWTAKLVKDLVGRGRPGAFFADANLREHAGGVGYVSGHAAVALESMALVDRTPSPLPTACPWHSMRAR